MNARNVVLGLLSVAVFSVAGVVNAACSVPSRLRAEVGINISQPQFRAHRSLGLHARRSGATRLLLQLDHDCGGCVHLHALTDSAAAGPVCWDPNDVPEPGPHPRNCTPIWDVEGQVWIDSDCETPILLNLGTFDIRAGSPRRVAWTAPDSDVAFLALD